MANNFSKFTEKFDFREIVNNVKSIITPGSAIPESVKDDPLIPKIAAVSTLAQQLIAAHQQQTADLNKLNDLVNSLYRDLEAVKKAWEAQTTGSSGTSTTSDESQKTRSDFTDDDSNK